MRWLALAAVTVIAFACGGPGPTTLPLSARLAPCDADAPPGPPVAGAASPASERPPDDALAILGLHASCGQLEVAGLSSRRTIQVAIVSDLDREPLRGRRVLAWHPGGPGISAVQRLLGAPPEVDYTVFSVVTWDGAGASTTPGGCGPESADFATDRDPHDPARADAVGDECRSVFGAESGAGAHVAAAELESVRASLGTVDVDLLMHSYGTAVAEAYIEAHPQRVRRAVLDGPMALDATWSGRIAAIERALDAVTGRFLERCVSACGTELAALAADSYERLRAAILRVHPQVGSGRVTLTGVMLDQATLVALRDPRAWDAYLDTLDAALSGDGSAVWTVAEQHAFSLDRSVYYTSLCADVEHPAALGGYRVPPPDTLLATFVSDLAPCVAIPATGPGRAGAETGSPDVLLVASDHDVLTPLGLVDQSPWLAGLPVCATSVVGHTSFGDPAVRDVVRTFLVTGGAADAARGCAALEP